MAANLAELAKTALIGELEKLRDQVRQLVTPLTDEQLWKKPLASGNSVGHLLLHLTGNLNHYVGGQLGHSGYFRDREREFTQTNVPPKERALAELDAAVATFRRVVGELSAEHLGATHPEARFGTVLETLVHLLAHFALHRGQISYLVRLVQNG